MPHWSTAARKALRFVHLAVNGVWLGAALGALLCVASDDPRRILAAYWLHDNVVVWLAIAVLCTGLMFALYTPWGVFRKWWIVAKWFGLLVLGLGIPFAAAPRIAALAARVDLRLIRQDATVDLAPLRHRAVLVLLAEVLLILLLFAISTWRPRRETAWSWQPQRRGRVALWASVGILILLSAAQSTVLQRARRTPLPRPTASGLADGQRQATIDWLGAPIKVAVEVSEERIARLEVLQQRRGLYTELAVLVCAKVEARGDLEVDGVSGATTSARGILLAASRALEQPLRPPSRPTASDEIAPRHRPHGHLTAMSSGWSSKSVASGRTLKRAASRWPTPRLM